MINMPAQLRAMIDRIPRLGARRGAAPEALEGGPDWVGVAKPDPDPEPDVLEGGPELEPVVLEPVVLEPVVLEPVVLEPVVLEPVVLVGADQELNSELIAAAREWISDCTWPDLDAELLDELSPEEILAGVEQHYAGGLEAFSDTVREHGYEEPAALSYALDSDGFATVHVTYQTHTLPANTYSWGCLKQECRPGLSAFLTKEESVTAALEHEQEHGYERELPTPTVEVTELEVASEIAETPTPEPDVLETPELEPASGPLSPEPEALEGGPDWVGVAKPDPDPEPDVLEGGPELESGFCNPPAPTSTPVLEPPVPTSEKDRITGQWIDALNDGTHRQVHGAWEEPRFSGGKKECTIQVGLNSVDGLDSVHDVHALYGNELVSDVLDMNDIRKKPFSTISKVLENELSPQYRQQRKDYGLDK